MINNQTPQLGTFDPVKKFAGDHNSWLNMKAERMQWYTDLQVKVSEKRFDLVLNLTSISAAFLAVALPLSPSFGMLFWVATYFFLAALCAGVGLLLVATIYDKKVIEADKFWVDSELEKIWAKASENLDKAIQQKIIQKDVDDYFAMRDALAETTKKREADRKSDWQMKVVNLSWIFYGIFAAGIVLLLISVAIYKTPNSLAELSVLH